MVNVLLFPVWIFSIPFELIWNTISALILLVLGILLLLIFIILLPTVIIPLGIIGTILSTIWFSFWMIVIAIDGIIVIIIYFEAPELFDKANTPIMDKEKAREEAGIIEPKNH